jgi:tripartite-type tricarboxylate transporter receptor subunit TctC
MLGVASEARWPSLPDVPTLAEQGHQVFIETLSGLAAPRAVPEPVVRKLVDSLDSCVQKYADQLREPFLRRETILVRVPGDELAKVYRQREALFKELALKMNLTEK